MQAMSAISLFGVLGTNKTYDPNALGRSPAGYA